MKIFSIRLAISLLTFTIGLSSPIFWFYYSYQPKIKVIEAKETDSLPACEPEYIEYQISESDERFWNKEILGRFKEQPLATTSNSIIESYRFTLIPTFDAPVSIRVWRGNDDYFLNFKKLSGQGGFGIKKFGKLNADTTLKLNKDEWFRFTSLLRRADFWAEPPLTMEETVPDGAEWVMEGIKEGTECNGSHYHEVHRITPSKELRESCNYLLKLTGFEKQYEGY